MKGDGTMSKYKMASLFAGIGGIDLGFELAGVNSIWANEIDQYAAQTFEANHPKTELIVDDIKNIKGKDIPKVHILAGGFPCQSFSIAGYRKGFEDDRGNLFFEIIRIIKEMEKVNNKPRVVFLENVKNLYTHDKGNTFKVIKSSLEDLNYIVETKVLNTCEYGNTPQNRERIFILAFLNKNVAEKFKWPEKVKLSRTIEDIINRDSDELEKYYYGNEKACYKLLNDSIKNKNSLYQYRRVYVRENKSGVCPTLTANMGTGGHNVPLLLDNKNRIRKVTPRECLLLQGFPKGFIIPTNLVDSKIYKQAGNAVSVSVIQRVAEAVIDAMKRADENE